MSFNIVVHLHIAVAHRRELASLLCSSPLTFYTDFKRSTVSFTPQQ